MFSLSAEPIDVLGLNQRLLHSSAGAYVVFEGRVRDLNKGKRVEALEYEAFEPLCKTEFASISREIQTQHPVLELFCMHRTGRLAIGEVAVWMGVLAVHRREAFWACEYGITELKKRLPIWKREIYQDQSSQWIDEACGCHG